MNNINVISPGSQEHRINMSILGIENQMSLLEHINTNNFNAILSLLIIFII